MFSSTPTVVAALTLAVLLLAEPSTAFLPRANDGPVHLELHASQQPRNVVRPEAGYLASRQLGRKVRNAGGVLQRQQDYDFNSYRDWLYNIQVAFGTPPQDFLLMLDTGSPLTWVFDSSCTPQKCSNKTGVGFDAGHSSTYRLNATFQHTIVYIDQGACNGPWGYDTVGITNGMSGPQRVNSSADNIFFMRCTEGNESFPETTYRGNFGMKWSAYSPTSLWMNLVPGWKDKRFGIYLAEQNVSSDAPLSNSDPKGGVLTLGGVNSKLFTGDINYVPLHDRAYRNTTPVDWGVTMDRAEYAGLQLASGTYAITDTGSTASFVPREVYNAVYANTPGLEHLHYDTGEELDIFPCTASTSFTELSLTLGGVQYTIPSHELAYHVQEWDHLGPRMCIPALLPNAFPEKFDWLIGIQFLKHVYSVYQYSPPAMGFAKLSPEAAPSTTNATSSGATGGGNATTAPSTTASNAPSAVCSTAVSLGVVAICVVLAVLA